jgi:transcriptional regulator of stress and heat shock response
MRNLADIIENFIIGELFNDDAKFVLVQRNELAEQLECAPSQISYAVSTRFTPDRGFVVESKRGSGGFIRIIKIQTASGKGGSVVAVNAMSAEQTLEHLLTNHLITPREAVLMNYNLELLEGHTSEKDKQMIIKESYKRLSSIHTKR